jgi:plastocyanin
MTLVRLESWHGLAIGLLALACGGDSGGGTGPPGPPTQLVKSGGDGQQWYVNNPLPTPYTVTVRDANNRAVPGVSVDWAITTGDGTISPNPSTTNSSGVATKVHTLGSASTYEVTAAVTGVQAVATFNATASAPPTSADVDVRDNSFIPPNVVVQSSGSVTWTQSGTAPHNVTFGSGPATPARISENDLAAGTAASRTRTLTAVGMYNYTCTNHEAMNGTVRVVN